MVQRRLSSPTTRSVRHFMLLLKCVVEDVNEAGELQNKLIETTIGRILFNQVVPKEVGYINEVLTKRSLRDIITVVMNRAGAAKVAVFLDDIKGMGYHMAFTGGLSFNLDAVIIPEEKETLVNEGYESVRCHYG